MENKTIKGYPSGNEGCIGTDGIACTSNYRNIASNLAYDPILYADYYSTSVDFNFNESAIKTSSEEDEDKIVIEFCLPGVKENDIKLFLEDNELIIKFLTNKEYTFFQIKGTEFRYPVECDYNLEIAENAVMANGVLVVSLNKLRDLEEIGINKG